MITKDTIIIFEFKNHIIFIIYHLFLTITLLQHIILILYLFLNNSSNRVS